jgi:hypothetical protein
MKVFPHPSVKLASFYTLPPSFASLSRWYAGEGRGKGDLVLPLWGDYGEGEQATEGFFPSARWLYRTKPAGSPW